MSVLVLAVLCVASSSCHSKTAESDLRFTQYYRQGEQLYIKHCSNCHQPNGRGLALVYPPLDTSDYMEKNFPQVICLMKNGIAGELMVNGRNFNQAMPGVPALTHLEVAEIATYIYNNWSHQRGLIEVKQVDSLLNKCAP